METGSLKKHKTLLDRLHLHDPVLVRILCVAAVLRLGYLLFAALSSTEFYILPDTASYLAPAGSLFSSGQFLNAAGDFEIFRTPGYPLVLGVLLFLLKGGYYWGAVGLNIVCNLLSIILLYKLTACVSGSTRAGYIAAGIEAVNFLDISFCGKVLSDIFGQFLGLLGIYFFVRYLLPLDRPAARPALLSLVWGALCLSLGLWVRPAFLYLPLALGAGLVIVLLIKKRWKQIIPAFLITILIPLLPAAGWMVRNTQKAGYAGYATVSAVNLYEYNTAALFAEQMGTDYYTAQLMLSAGEDEGLQPYLDTMPRYEAMQARAVELIRSNPGTYLKYCLLGAGFALLFPGVYDILGSAAGVEQDINAVKDVYSSDGLLAAGKSLLSSPGTVGILLCYVLGMVVLAGLLGMAVFGAIKISPWPVKCLLLGVWAYFFLLSIQPIGFGGYPRYRMSFFPYLLVFAAVGLDAVIRRWIQRHQKAVAEKEESRTSQTKDTHSQIR